MIKEINLSIHSWAIVSGIHLILIHAWRRRRSISLLRRRRIHMSTGLGTASLLSLLQRGILAARGSVHHRTGLHAMCQVSTVKHLTIHSTKVAVGECTQVLANVGVSVTFPDRLICIHFQTILTNRWQMHSYKHLHNI